MSHVPVRPRWWRLLVASLVTTTLAAAAPAQGPVVVRGQRFKDPTAEKATEEVRRKAVENLAPAVKERIKQARASVVVVRGEHGLGSGVFVADGIIATNSHVIADDPVKKLVVEFVSTAKPEPEKFAVRLLFEDRQQDLALLAIEKKPTALPLAKADKVQEGMDLAVIGNPAETNEIASVAQVTVGKLVETAARIQDSTTWYRIDAYAEKGNSGGPVICQQSGAVIGLLTFRKGEKDEQKNYCVPSSAIAKALGSLGPKAGYDKLAERQRIAHDAYATHLAVKSFNESAVFATDVWTKTYETWYRSSGQRTIIRVGNENVDGLELAKELGQLMGQELDRARKLYAHIRGSKDVPANTRTLIERELQIAEDLNRYLPNVSLTVSGAAQKKLTADTKKLSDEVEKAEKEFNKPPVPKSK